jgi:hypothetical protein
MDVEQIERQIERRLASMMVDEDARHGLESLAEEYEANAAKVPQFHAKAERRCFVTSRYARSSSILSSATASGSLELAAISWAR